MKKTEKIRSEIKEKKYNIMPNQKTGTIPLYKKLKAGIIALFAKDKNQHRDSLLKAGAVLASIPAIVFSVTACQVETEESHELVQKSVEGFTSVSEFEEECQNIYSIKENVVENIEKTIKENYGADAKICSIFYDWKDKFDGDVFAIVNINDKIEVLKFSNEINIEDISKTIYKNGTYELENNVLKYYTYLGENALDLTNQKFYVEEETGDLIIIENLNILDVKITEAFGKFEKVDTNLSNSSDEEKLADAKYAMQYFLQSDTEASFLNTSLVYDENQDKTIYSVRYLSAAKTYNLIKFEFSGNVIDENGLLNRNITEEQFKYYEVKTSEIKKNTVETAPVAIIKEEMPQTTKLNSNQKYIEDGNLPPEQIEINSWEELFNILGEENSFLIKDKIIDILKNNLVYSEKLYSLIDPYVTSEDIEPLKMYIALKNDNLFNIKVFYSYNFYKNYFSLNSVNFQFAWDINYKDIDVKCYKKFNIESKNQLKVKTENGFIVVDFSMFEYLVKNAGFAFQNESIENFADPPLDTTKFFDDLLTPLTEKTGLIVSSFTLYKNFVCKENNINYIIEGSFVDLKTFKLKKINFYLQHHENSNIKEACQNAVDNGEYEIVLVSEEVISADGIEIDLTDGKYQSASNIIDENEK